MAFGFYIDDKGSVQLGDNSYESIRLVIGIGTGGLRYAPLIAGNVHNALGNDERQDRLIDAEQALLSDGADEAEVTSSESLTTQDSNIVSVTAKYP